MPTATKTAARRRMTQAALIAEGLRRTPGGNAFQIRYRCPACGNIQTAAEVVPPGDPGRAALGCWGCGFTAEEATGEQRAALIRVALPGGEKTDSFPLADELDDDAPSGPQDAAQEPGATRGPVRDDIASAPLPVPASDYLTGDTDDAEREVC